MKRAAALPFALVLACVVIPVEDESTSTQETAIFSTGPGDSGSGSAGSVSESDAGSSNGSTGDASASSDADGGFVSTGFVQLDHGGIDDGWCDFWTQNDCPNGQKCTAVAAEVGSNSWDSNQCRDILGWQGVGEPCEYFGTGIDGLDDCELGAMCWNQDPDTGLGTCIQFCQGTPSQPTCAVGSSCSIGGDGVLALCIPNCNPLAQDCDGNDLCLPDFNDTGFVCLLDASGDMAPYGTPCEFVNVCNSGLICIAPESVPEPACEGASGCCSPMCDINAANTCPGVGQVCASLYETGMEPPGYDHMGVCAVPT